MSMNTYIIAEIGINHNSNYENCIKLIDSASVAGCHAAKFQLFTAKALYPKSAGELDWQDGKKKISYSIYDAVERFELPVEWVQDLITHCDRKKIEFLSSVFDISGLNILLKSNLKKIKLSSYTITNIPLIDAVAQTGLPIIMSTGGANLSETEKAVETILKYHDNLTLLHCSIKYPTQLEECNLAVLKTLQYAYPGLKVGYSDHTIQISDAVVQSIYLGASVIEKHITLDKNMDGPDHFFALEPGELKKMVEDVKSAESHFNNGTFVIDKQILGDSSKICHEHEKYLRDFCYMTLFCKRNLKKGEQIKSEDIEILRPGKAKRGLDPAYIDLFQTNIILAKKDLNIEDSICWEHIL